MFDPTGKRVDEILYPPEYWRMLKHGYQTGLLWRVFEENSVVPAGLGIYVTSFYDPGLACPYTVSLSTAVPLSKYGDAELRQRFLPRLLQKDESVWQGATWMTEIRGGSDLGATVETIARPAANHWSLTGDKYLPATPSRSWRLWRHGPKALRRMCADWRCTSFHAVAMMAGSTISFAA